MTRPCNLDERFEVTIFSNEVKRWLGAICQRSGMSPDEVISKLIEHHKNDRLSVETRLVIEPDVYPDGED